jgi:predicted exporter
MAMARRRGRKPVVPEAGRSLDLFKAAVMEKAGYRVSPDQPNQVKFEVAKSLGIPLSQDYNGQLKAEDAGKIGGQIGGKMVREMIRIAQQQLSSRPPR